MYYLAPEFRGADRQTVFITTDAGLLYSIRMRVQGRAIEATVVLARCSRNHSLERTGSAPNWRVPNPTRS